MVEEAPEQPPLIPASAKEEILARIREAVPRRSGDRETDYAYIPRQYRTTGPLDLDGRLDLFTDRLQDYGATVYECLESKISKAVAEVLAGRNIQRLATGKDFPGGWIPAGFDFYPDYGFTGLELDQFQGVVTSCAIGIAETGTIVLRHAGEEPRRAVSLIPDYHLCIIFAHQVVETVPEGVRQMAAMGNVPLTTISGPSATSDIEMTRVKGVHGPRTLDVILIVQ